jgi:hypothetical protein
MNHTQLIGFTRNKFDQCIALMEAKNTDYAHGDDAFANFRKGELIEIPVEKSIYLRMQDKCARLESYLKSGQLAVKDESVKDTLMDLANYSMILCAYLSGDAVVENPVEPLQVIAPPKRGRGRPRKHW